MNSHLSTFIASAPQDLPERSCRATASDILCQNKLSSLLGAQWCSVRTFSVQEAKQFFVVKKSYIEYTLWRRTNPGCHFCGTSAPYRHSSQSHKVLDEDDVIRSCQGTNTYLRQKNLMNSIHAGDIEVQHDEQLIRNSLYEKFETYVSASAWRYTWDNWCINALSPHVKGFYLLVSQCVTFFLPGLYMTVSPGLNHPAGYSHHC